MAEVFPQGDIRESHNFQIATPKPMDSRFRVATLADLENITFPYPGLQTFVDSENTTYECKADLTWEIAGGGLSGDTVPHWYVGETLGIPKVAPLEANRRTGYGYLWSAQSGVGAGQIGAPGGGATFLAELQDVNPANWTNNQLLRYDISVQKWYSWTPDFAAGNHTHSWDDIQSKPSSFPPSAHNHDGVYVKPADTFFIGTTQVAHNRASGTLNLAGIGTLGVEKVTVSKNLKIPTTSPDAPSGGGYLWSSQSGVGAGTIGSSDLSGVVPKTTTITINGVTWDLSANRTWNVATSGGDLTKAQADTYYLGINANAQSATKWGTQTYDSTIAGTGLNVMMGFNSTAAKWSYYTDANVKSWLGLGSNAYKDGWIETGARLTDLNSMFDSYGALRYYGYNSDALNKPYTNNNANGVLMLGSHGGPYGKQIAFGDSDDLYMRNVRAGVFQPWRTIYHTGNFNPGNYVPVSGNVAVTGYLGLNNGGLALIMYGGSYIGYFDNTGSTRRSYLSHNGSNMVYNTDVGNHVFAISATSWSINLASRQNWGGANYPTIHGSHADEWVMMHNIHVPYLQNGQYGYAGSYNGARIRFAAQVAATQSWDIGVLSEDNFKINRNTSTMMSVSNSGVFYFYNSISSGGHIRMRLADNVAYDTGMYYDGNQGQTYNKTLQLFVEGQSNVSYRGAFRFKTKSGIGTVYKEGFYLGITAWDEGSGTETSDLLQIRGDGNVYVKGDAVGFNTSDPRLKDNMSHVYDPLSILSKVGTYKFTWNNKQSAYDEGMLDFGYSALEVQKVLPEIVTTRETGYLAMKYDRMTVINTGAINQLNYKVESKTRQLEKRIKTLEEKVIKLGGAI